MIGIHRVVLGSGRLISRELSLPACGRFYRSSEAVGLQGPMRNLPMLRMRFSLYISEHCYNMGSSSRTLIIGLALCSVKC